MFVSLPGLTLAVDEVDEFEDVMKTAEKAIRNYINDEPIGCKIYEMEDPDVLFVGCMGIATVCQGNFTRSMPGEIRILVGGNLRIYPFSET